jgi:hypothetical protein
MTRTEQTSGLVEVLVVGPAVEGSKSLLTHSTTTTTVHGTVSTSAVPSHTDEETTIVTKVSRPPILRISKKLMEILLQRLVYSSLAHSPNNFSGDTDNPKT